MGAFHFASCQIGCHVHVRYVTSLKSKKMYNLYFLELEVQDETIFPLIDSNHRNLEFYSNCLFNLLVSAQAI